MNKKNVKAGSKVIPESETEPAKHIKIGDRVTFKSKAKLAEHDEFLWGLTGVVTDSQEEVVKVQWNISNVIIERVISPENLTVGG